MQENNLTIRKHAYVPCGSMDCWQWTDGSCLAKVPLLRHHVCLRHHCGAVMDHPHSHFCTITSEFGTNACLSTISYN